MFFKKKTGENKLVKSACLLLFNIKLINSIEKYPQITEPYACIL